MKKKRIAILGGGMGSLSAVYWLTNMPGWEREYELTVYQLGWRLGGKAASGRNQGAWQRTEEHGFHMLFGFYENTFATMRGCYASLGRGPGSPLSEFCAVDPDDEHRFPERYAVKRNSLLFLAQEFNGKQEHVHFDFPTNDRVPGDGGIRGPWTALQDLFRWFRHVTTDPQWAPPRRRGAQSHGRAGLEQLAPDVAETVRASFTEGALRTHGPLELALLLAGTFTGSPSRRTSLAIVGLLTAYLRNLWETVRADIETDWASYRAWILHDYVATNLIGLLADDVLSQGYESIDDINYADWLLRHSAVPEGTRLTVQSVLCRFAYNACFAFEGGDAVSPPSPDKLLRGAANMEAGTMLRGGSRLFLSYKGAIDWVFQVGCGDALVAPLYELLARRGVRFKFFHKVLGLGLDAEARAVATIRMERQATLSVGEYQPLIMVKGVPSWPSEPLYPQIVEGAALQARQVNLESHWTDWKGEEFALRRGRDFDDVVLGISLGALPELAADLAIANPKWQRMFDKVKTTRTFGYQTWLTHSESELGWHHGPVRSDTGCEPTCMEAEATPVVAFEAWPEGSVPRNLTYFGGVMPDDPNEPRTADPAYPRTQDERVAAEAASFLSEHGRVYWPGSSTPAGFRWEILADPGDATGQGPARLRSQFWRANIDPSERYVLSVVGSTKYRLTADGSGFDNLYLAGDWIKTGLDCGCMEATVMSGMQASRAVCGYPRVVPGERPVSDDDGGDDEDIAMRVEAFAEFCRSLPDAERATLYASIPRLIGIVACADGAFSRLERRAVSRVMDEEVRRRLGDDFRWSHAARREYRALSDGSPRSDGLVDEWLAALREVLHKMPDVHRNHYTSFVTTMVLDVADQSGTWLWFGARIDANELTTLQQIAAALELGVPR